MFHLGTHQKTFFLSKKLKSKLFRVFSEILQNWKKSRPSVFLVWVIFFQIFSLCLNDLGPGMSYTSHFNQFYVCNHRMLTSSEILPESDESPVSLKINSVDVTLLWQGYSNMTSCCLRAFVQSTFHLKSLGKSWSNVSQPIVKWQSALGDKSSSHDSACLWFNWRPQIRVDNGCQTVLICSVLEWLVENWNWWRYSEIKCLLCSDRSQRVEILINVKSLKLQSAVVASACLPTSVAMQQSGDKLIIQSGAQAANCLLVGLDLQKMSFWWCQVIIFTG